MNTLFRFLFAVFAVMQLREVTINFVRITVSQMKKKNNSKVLCIESNLQWFQFSFFIYIYAICRPGKSDKYYQIKMCFKKCFSPITFVSFQEYNAKEMLKKRL